MELSLALTHSPPAVRTSAWPSRAVYGGNLVLAVPSLCHLDFACPNLGLGRLPSTLKQGLLVVGFCHLLSQDYVAVPIFLPLPLRAVSEDCGGLVWAL